MTVAVAEYRGGDPASFSENSDWFALGGAADVAPDAFAPWRGANGACGIELWAEVPVSMIDGVIDVRVRGTVGGGGFCSASYRT